MKTQYCTNEIPRHFVSIEKQKGFNEVMAKMADHLTKATGKRVEWWYVVDSCCAIEPEAGHFRIYGE